jgi:hypothetical protein
MKKIVLVYSKDHFDPIKSGEKGGAGYLASSIYRMLTSTYSNANLEYYDHTEHNLVKCKDSNSDLLVGISNNIHLFNNKLHPKQSVLFAVNYSAIHRRKIRRKLKEYHFDKKWLNWEDGIYSNLNELDGVTAVVTLGNFSNFLSYVGSGVTPSRVFPISSSLGHKFHSNKRRRIFGEDVLYFPGGISFRKGAGFLRPIVAWLESQRAGTMLRVIGRATDPELNEYIRQIVTEFPNNIIWEQRWIDRDSNIWKENISKSRFAIFPSFEEGLPASVLDLIESDIPVLYSSACGLDFVSKDVVPKSMGVSDWINLLRSMITRSDEFIAELLNSQQLMLENLPEGIVQFESMINRVYSESIWPSTEISDSLKMQIPKDSWLLKSKEAMEYKIYESDSVHPIYPVNEIFSLEEMAIESLIAIAITQIDRYPNFIGLTIQHNYRFIIIERTTLNLRKSIFQNRENSTKLDLFTVVDRQNISKWPTIEKNFTLLKQRIIDSIVHRFKDF